MAHGSATLWLIDFQPFQSTEIETIKDVFFNEPTEHLSLTEQAEAEAKCLYMPCLQINNNNNNNNNKWLYCTNKKIETSKK